MATEQTGDKPTAQETGEAGSPPSAEKNETASADASKEADAPAAESKPAKAKAPAKPRRAPVAKGTTGASTTTADGAPAAQAMQGLADAAQAIKDSAGAGLRTVTGSDEETTGVYNGEPPMSAEDNYKASQGRDPLKTTVPDGAAYGNMGPMHVAVKTEAPIGPTGNVPTGSPHSAVKEAAKLVKPITEAQAEAEEASA